MTPLPWSKSTGVHAGRCATSTSSEEEPRAGHWALKVHLSHTLSRATGIVGPWGAGASGRVCSLEVRCWKWLLIAGAGSSCDVQETVLLKRVKLLSDSPVGPKCAMAHCHLTGLRGSWVTRICVFVYRKLSIVSVQWQSFWKQHIGIQSLFSLIFIGVIQLSIHTS